MDLQAVNGGHGFDFLAHVTEKWQDIAVAVMKLRVPQNAGIS
jgi:hypothetical protein